MSENLLIQMIVHHCAIVCIIKTISTCSSNLKITCKITDAKPVRSMRDFSILMCKTAHLWVLMHLLSVFAIHMYKS